MTRRRTLLVGAVGTAAALTVAALAPLAVVLGAGRLVVTVLVVSGAWATVGRAGVPDLSAALGVAAGAIAGGLLPATTGVPTVLGPVLAVVAGAVVGAAGGALVVRLGPLRGALATLALSAAAPAAVAAWPGSGGAAGFHAVPLFTGSDRGDLVVVTSLAVVAVAVLGAVASGRRGAAATVALTAPHVVAGTGRRPAAAAAPLAATGGAVLGLAGWGSAVLGGSVLPAATGLPLVGLAVLGAALAGRSVLAAVAAALLLAGPAVVWPLVPVVGDAPPLLTTGPLAVAWLLLRGPLADRPAPPAEAVPPPLPSVRPAAGLALDVDGLPLAHGATCTLAVPSGGSLLVRGPNGAGKSTLLAAVAGQLADHGRVRLDGRAAPRGPVGRARAGVARTWQRPPDTAGDDLAAAAGLAGRGWTPGRAQVAAAVAARPRLLLLDEPSAFLDPDELDTLLSQAAAGGVTVVLVEHGDAGRPVAEVVTVGREGAS